MDQRLARVREKIKQAKLDALIITRPENLYWLSGFGGGEYLDATMIVSAAHAWISTDSRYYEEVKQSAPDFKLFLAGYDRNKVLGKLGKAKPAPKRVGFEAAHLTAATLATWNEHARKAGFKLKPTGGIVEELRIVKTPDELAKIKRAVAITDAAFAHFCRALKPGMTERQGAWIIEKFMRENGADNVAFELIVAAGPNGALPHARPTERVIQRGEPIVVDIGARVDHYHSDLTRTIVLGEADAKFHQVYNTVLAAQRAAEDNIRAGVKGKRADRFARDVIQATEWGKTFGHGLGHGVGLAVHEGPRASKLSKDTYRENMTLTIEPGIYLPGWGGVRIEDLVVISKDGVEILSQASKEPVVRV